MDLSTKFDGLVLKNPLMPAAGPLVGDAEKMLWLNHVAGSHLNLPQQGWNAMNSAI